MFHRSERLFLRPVFVEDWRQIYRGIADESVVTMLARAPWPYRQSDALAFASAKVEPKYPRFAITLPGAEGAPLIGVCGIHDEGGKPHYGYWIAREHWGHGYATEAGRAVCRAARSLGHVRLHAGHYLDNPASGRVLRKIGFVESGEITPTECRARGGELVLTRCFVLDLAETDVNVDAGAMRAA